MDILLNIPNQEKWDEIYQSYHSKYPIYNETNKDELINIGPELSTHSASSLTNGPTLYISNQLENISKFLLTKNNINKEENTAQSPNGLNVNISRPSFLLFSFVREKELGSPSSKIIHSSEKFFWKEFVSRENHRKGKFDKDRELLMDSDCEMS